MDVVSTFALVWLLVGLSALLLVVLLARRP